MKVVLLVEIEMGSLRVALEKQISKADWAQWKMVHAFKKRVKPRPLQMGVDPSRCCMVDGSRHEPILRVNNQFSESSNSHRMGGRHFC
ncbi:hypothetical protein AAG906_021548 [Vitis piasezkii]